MDYPVSLQKFPVGKWALLSILSICIVKFLYDDRPLHEKIDSVDFARVKVDISRFIANPDVLEIWSPRYFHDLTDHLKIEEK